MEYDEALKKLQKAEKLMQKALELVYEVDEQAPFSTGETPFIALCMNGRDSEWLAKHYFGIA